MFCRRWFLTFTALVMLCAPQTRAFPQQNRAPDSNSPAQPPPPTQRDEIDILDHPPETKVAPSLLVLPEIKIPNFSSCSIAELQKTVPQLAHLETSQDQAKLLPLLDKIGAKTVEIARKTPNLISNEAVVLEQSGFKTHQNFSFLVLRHDMGQKGIVFDEYRVDPASGKRFQTEEVENTNASKSVTPGSPPLELPSLEPPMPGSDGAPTSQGFVNGWLHFYPSNRRLADFRYLGQQKMDGHQTLVVAFAQKPAFVQLPAIVSFEDKTVPAFLQGVAWVDASDFRIVRLRTDLLSQPTGVPLRRLTADIQFTQTAIAEVASPLWLPRQVVVTTILAGVTVHESHTYSDYRFFRAKTRVILNP